MKSCDIMRVHKFIEILYIMTQIREAEYFLIIFFMPIDLIDCHFFRRVEERNFHDDSHGKWIFYDSANFILLMKNVFFLGHTHYVIFSSMLNASLWLLLFNFLLSYIFMSSVIIAAHKKLSHK